MNDVVVFLGPSLPVDEARAILDAEYLPPVKMGDVQALLDDPPRIIVIIDGFFERVPAVWHKEILCALSRGVRVVGASSMGALRAAELATFGMEGVGGIFEAFRSGVLDADDEVAIAHATADEGYRPLSEALVNLRDGLAAAERAGILTSLEREALVEASRARFYPERSWVNVFRDASRAGVDPARVERLQMLIASDKPNAKRRDAVAALRHVGATRDRPAPAPSFEFEPTEFWEQLVATSAGGGRDREGREALAAQVMDHARVVIDDYRGLRLSGLGAMLANIEADRAGVRVTQERLSAYADRFRRRHGLLSADETRAWLESNAMGSKELTDLAALEIALDEVSARYGRKLDEALVAELRRSGAYQGLAAAVERASEALAAGAGSTFEDAGLDEHAALAWYEKTHRTAHGGVETHARDRGFRNAGDFLRAVKQAWLADHAKR